MIAQDVKKVLPEAVTEKDGVLGVKYTEVIPLVINAVKELYGKWHEDSAALHAKVEKLEKENAELKATSERQARDLAAIKKKLGL